MIFIAFTTTKTFQALFLTLGITPGCLHVGGLSGIFSLETQTQNSMEVLPD